MIESRRDRVWIAVALLSTVLLLYMLRQPNPEIQLPSAAPDSPLPRGTNATSVARVSRSSAPDHQLPISIVDLDAVDRDTGLCGVVIDEEHDPIAGARIEAIRYALGWSAAPGMAERAEDVCATVVSAEDGSFLMTMNWGASVNLRVSAPGYATTSFSMKNAGERVELVLGPASEVEFRVRDEMENPVSGVRLRVRQQVGSQHTHREALHGVTDRDGRCLIGDASPGPAIAYFDSDGPSRPSSRRIEIEPGIRNVIDIVVPTGRGITGRVVSDQTGEPIVGAIVSTDFYHRRTPIFLTDESGAFTMTGFVDGRDRSVFVDADGYGLASRWIEAADSHVEFRLIPGMTVRGTVVDDSGPVAGAFVSAVACEGWIQDLERDSRVAHTKHDGTFEITALRDDLRQTLSVFAEGSVPAFRRLAEYDSEDGIKDVGEIRLDRGYRVDGSVVDERFEPITGASVTLLYPVRGPCLPDGDQRRTDDLGRFRLVHVGPGTHQVRVRADDREPRTETIEVDDRDLNGLRFILGDSAWIRLRTIDAVGEPVANVRWSAVWSTEASTADARSSARSNKDGDAYITGVPRRRIRLDARPPQGYLRPAAITVVPDNQTVDVELIRAADIEGTVTWESGGPATGITVRAVAIAGEGTAFHAQTDSDGAFTIAVPEGLTVGLAIRASKGSAAGDQEIYLLGRPVEAKSPASDVSLTAGRHRLSETLAILVVDSAGAPVDGALVQVRSDHGSKARNLHTGHDGRAFLDGAAADFEYALQAYPPAAPREYAPREYFPSRIVRTFAGRDEVILELLDPFAVEGEVLDRAGIPAAGRWVHAAASGEIVATTVTSAEGRFRLIMPIGGRYHLSVTDDRAGKNTLPCLAPPTVDAAIDDLLLQLVK